MSPGKYARRLVAKRSDGLEFIDALRGCLGLAPLGKDLTPLWVPPIEVELENDRENYSAMRRDKSRIPTEVRISDKPLSLTREFHK